VSEHHFSLFSKISKFQSFLSFLSFSSVSGIMSSLPLEARILNSIINKDPCWICLEIIDDSLGFDRHGMIPTPNIRAASCGHVVHRDCAQKFLRESSTVMFVDFDSDSEIQHEVYGVKCYCGLLARSFITADSSLGNKLIYFT
jgi:hypothetical protein